MFHFVAWLPSWELTFACSYIFLEGLCEGWCWNEVSSDEWVDFQGSFPPKSRMVHIYQGNQVKVDKKGDPDWTQTTLVDQYLQRRSKCSLPSEQMIDVKYVAHAAQSRESVVRTETMLWRQLSGVPSVQHTQYDWSDVPKFKSRLQFIPRGFWSEKHRIILTADVCTLSISLSLRILYPIECIYIILTTD